MRIPLYVYSSVGAVVLLFLVAGLSKAAQVAPQTSPDKVAKQLLQSAADKLRAAEQDAKPIQQLCDAHFGMAYVNAARMLSTSDAALATSTGVNVGDLHASLRAHQQDAYESVCLAHPDLRL